MIQARDVIYKALAQAMHAKITTLMKTLGSTPGSLSFSRDKLFNIPFVAEWQEISQNREKRINDDLLLANRKRSHFECAPGRNVLNKFYNKTKLGVTNTSP